MGERLRAQSGQTFAFVAIAMTSMLGMAALVVDAGSWYQKHRKVQAAADAAATAAASYLPSDTSGSILAATTYVNKNISGATTTTATPYGGDSRKVEVKVSANAPTFFARLFGVDSVTVDARAVAMREDGGDKWAVYSDHPGCSPEGILLGGSSNVITGRVHSNGSLQVSGSNNTLGETTYGGPNNCYSNNGGQGNKYGGGADATRDNKLYTWPQPWFFSAPPAGVCTYSQGTFDFGNSNMTIPTGTYCATNEIKIGGQYITCTCTFIAPKIDVSGSNFTATPHYQSLLFNHYGTDAEFKLQGSDANVTGTIFVPYERLSMSGSTGSVYNVLLEGKTVSISGSGWTLNGNGPAAGYSGTRLVE